MEWTQIQRKWGEMARRVRADVRYGNSIDSAGSEFLSAVSDPAANTVPNGISVIGTKSNRQLETVSTR